MSGERILSATASRTSAAKRRPPAASLTAACARTECRSRTGTAATSAGSSHSRPSAKVAATIIAGRAMRSGDARRQRRRRLQQQRLAFLVAHQMHEGAHRALRRVVGRQFRRDQLRALVAHAGLAHPADEHVRMGAERRQRIDDALGRVRGGRDRGRAIGDQQAVVIVVLHQDVDRVAITVGVGIADDVHRIATGPGRRQHLVERASVCRRQRGKRAAATRSAHRWRARRRRRHWSGSPERSPRCDDMRASVSTASNSSSSSSTRSMPARRNAAS